MDQDLVDQVIHTAGSVVASGAISANGHGNVSIRVPGAEEMYFTSAPSLRGLTADGVVRVGLDGSLLEGALPPIQGAVVAMHTAMYADRDDVGCVIHTHSPYATAYAVARRPIDVLDRGAGDVRVWPTACPSPATARVGRTRRSRRSAVPSGRANPAVLLANHGVAGVPPDPRARRARRWRRRGGRPGVDQRAPHRRPGRDPRGDAVGRPSARHGVRGLQARSRPEVADRPVLAQASMTTGMIIGRRRSSRLTQRPTTRRTTCWSW